MVERVKITPSQILLKDGDGNIKFNTDNYYLKTGSGTLYAGGYGRVPAIYGQNTITDHTNYGSYAPGLFTAAATFNQASTWRYYWNVPKCVSPEFKLVGNWEEAGQSLSANNIRTLEYFNYDTRVLSSTNITYRWRVARIGQWDGSVDGYGNHVLVNHYFAVWPIFSSNTMPEISNPNGGTFEVAWTANEHLSWTYTTSDNYGNTYNHTGNELFAGQTIQWRPNGIFSKRDPVALSLAVTP